jgi:hypothetical protein
MCKYPSMQIGKPELTLSEKRLLDYYMVLFLNRGLNKQRARAAAQMAVENWRAGCELAALKKRG